METLEVSSRVDLMGLAIVKEIIGLLSEKIWVESDENSVKFIFTVKMP